MTPASLEPALYLSARELERIRYINEAHLRCCQKSRDQFQDFGVSLVGIVKARRVDEYDGLSVKNEFICELNFGGARFQVHSDTKTGAARHVDELDRGSMYGHGSGL